MCLGRLLEHFVNVKFDDIVTVIMMSFQSFTIVRPIKSSSAFFFFYLWRNQSASLRMAAVITTGYG
jgi:hypothetical protein